MMSPAMSSDTATQTAPPAAPPVRLLEVERAVKRFRIRKGMLVHETLIAVDGVSFTVHEGETVGLVGESGCGKSTIGRCILRLLDLDAGQIRFHGAEIQNLPEQQFLTHRKHIQMVFQNPLASFDPLLSLRESLLEPLRLRADIGPKEKEDEIARLLEQVGLRAEFAHLKPHQVSGGQLQRVALARALATRPQFIFLDEPTSALDMSIRGQIVNLLLDIQGATRLSYLFVSHDLRVVRFVADRVMVMYLGQIVEEARKDELFGNPMHPYTRGLLASTVLGREKRMAVWGASRLRGEVVQAGAGLVGCRLYHRCGYATERCRDEQVLAAVRSNHWVRCWRAPDLWGPEAPRRGAGT
jgi:oligopeptide/dipeptide ABC transporter ATP-binding protein